jgi:uncharacterized membrane protein (DUF106 family)
MKDIATKAAIALGAVLFIGIIFSEDFRISLGLALDALLFPLSSFKFHITILFLSILTATYSNIIQKYTMDYEKLKKGQQILREYQKEYMEAMKQDNKFKLKQLEERKTEIQKIQSELMSMQFKPMFLTFVVTIPIFAWLWEKAVASYSLTHNSAPINITANLPQTYLSSLDPSLYNVTVPFSGAIHVATPVLIVPWWLLWYMLCSVMFGQIIKKLLKVGM